ncbi:dihydrofolate reductase [Ornithinibacillus halophilus]|uniref:Dihydrofolate reductase n=1 Tax=Ornithinibacillus halophilus TaxID=930117 RepID=A0A1M5CKL7_9BACI|nr:dihydrofolate reductase [Ornithinibacillus halophilus]SHF55325.1 dihydrofolate reductase [Ornithinibacillus halophilus]
MISLLVAMDRNLVIGANNDLPWHLPNDLKFFKGKTTGNTIIMGRKTFESIGRALPNRKNVVLTSNPNSLPADVEVISDVDTILKWNQENPDTEYFVIGGGMLFKEILPYADRMYITRIEEAFEGDTYFPVFSEDEWKITSNEQGVKDEKNPYSYHFIQYDRIKK